MAYQRGQVVRLIRPITEVRIAEDHGSSVWASCDGLSGYVRTSNIEKKRPAGAQKTLAGWERAEVKEIGVAVEYERPEEQGGEE